jgi:hypothetical protein
MEIKMNMLMPMACGFVAIYLQVPDLHAADATGGGVFAEVQVEARKKPADEWKAYPTRTLAQSPGVPANPPLDRFGGLLAGQAKATGFFHAKLVAGRWWLIDPDGGRFFNAGLADVAPGNSDNNRAALKARFGDADNWVAQTVAQLKDHGFNGVGAWSDVPGLRACTNRLVYTMIWNFMSGYGKKRGGTFQQPGHTGYPSDCIFVFDPGFETFCDEAAKALAATKDDPWLLGHFSDNELPFPRDALDKMLKLPATDAGHQAAQAWLTARHPGAITDADRDAFLGFMTERYFRITTQAIRKYDPNHLCLGSRLHGGDLAKPVIWSAAGKYLDVVAVNYYGAWTPDPARMRTWVEAAGKPFLVTEWYVKGMDSGMANTTGAGWCVKTQRDRGWFYQNFALGLLASKGCVGWHWFKYMDNDPADLHTDPSNRDSNKGVVTFRYEPYPPLLDAMKQLNERM